MALTFIKRCAGLTIVKAARPTQCKILPRINSNLGEGHDFQEPIEIHHDSGRPGAAAGLCAGRALKMVPLGTADAAQTVGLVAPHREPHTPIIKALMNEARRMSELP